MAGEKLSFPEDIFWNVYLEDAAEEDKYLPDSWESNTGSILTFTGLFAATVAAFLIESYKSLSPDSGDQTAMLLQQLLVATANVSAQKPVEVPSSDAFHAMPTDIAVNALWFSSLLIALVCALLSTLVQEWARDYRRGINRRRTLDESPQHRAFNHIFVRMGIERYGMDSVVYWITALVHLSVILFIVGLIVFLFPIDHIVASITAAVVGVFVLAYIVASMLPLVESSCPYRTPITYFVISLLRFIRRFPPCFASTRLAKLYLSTPAFHKSSTRSTLNYRNFLTSPRFAFAWDRASRHMMHSPKQFNDLLKALEPIMSQNLIFTGSGLWYDAHNSSQFDHLCQDVAFIRKLGQSIGSSMVGEVIDPVIFKTVSFLSERFFALGTVQPKSTKMGFATGAYFCVLEKVATIVSANRDGMEKLMSQLCLANVRHQLVRACESADRRQMPVPTEDQIEELVPTNELGYVDCEAFTAVDCHPVVHLLSIQFLSLSTVKFTKRKECSRSYLVPLHDGDCCKSMRSMLLPNGWAHEAASSMLTVISDLLDASDDFRDNIDFLDSLKYVGWSDVLAQLERRPPSTEFISVLRTAGLDAWLEPNSDFSRKAIRRTTHRAFLTSWPGEQLVSEMQGLAEHVDWVAYHQSRIVDMSRTSSFAPLVQATSSQNVHNRNASQSALHDAHGHEGRDSLPVHFSTAGTGYASDTYDMLELKSVAVVRG